MYYYPNPYLYQFQGQMFFIPQVFSPQSVLQGNFQRTQSSFKEKDQQKKTNNSEIQVNSRQNRNLGSAMKSPDAKQVQSWVDGDYQPKNQEIVIFYKKKNTESNLSNQIYSFISSDKSMRLIMKLLRQNEEKVEEFYKLIKRIKKINKKYMNRQYISDLIKLKQKSTNFKIYTRSKCSLQIEEVRKVLRISVRYFLHNVCDSGLLTSKKMNKDTLSEHFSRKRQITEFLSTEILHEN